MFMSYGYVYVANVSMGANKQQTLKALVEAEKSDFLKEVMGEQIYRNMMELKVREWEEDRTHITSREYHKYMNV